MTFQIPYLWCVQELANMFTTCKRFTLLWIQYPKQECIPVGCVLSAAVAVSPAMHAPHHACPLPHTLPCHACPLPHMPHCHACPPCHAHPPAMHTPCHTCPPAMHTPCHTCPLPCMPPAMHTPCHACPPAMHTTLPCMSPCGQNS